MKFLYEYRTKDNVRHEGVIDAASRDAAFAALKAQGIRPGSVKEAPGFFNKLFGKGKRWIAIAVLTVAAVIAFTSARRAKEEAKSVRSAFELQMRHQLIGDLAVIERGQKTGWADVFAHQGERFLAGYAIPGEAPAVTGVPENKLRDALGREIEIKADDSIEVRQVKSIVEGMKNEARAYLADGGTLMQYGSRLVRRQREEAELYERSKNEIETAVREKMPVRELAALWEKRNEGLRRLGIRTIPAPEIEGFFAP